MLHHDIELMTAGELLLRLGEEFRDRMRAAAETVRHSRKSATDLLGILEAAVGKYAADIVRRLVMP